MNEEETKRTIEEIKNRVTWRLIEMIPGSVPSDCRMIVDGLCTIAELTAQQVTERKAGAE